MPEIKIVTEVAGRVCALPVEIGGSVGDGDDVAFVEAQSGAYVIAILTDGSYEGWLALHRVVPEVHAALSD